MLTGLARHAALGVASATAIARAAVGLYEPIHGSAPDIAGQRPRESARRDSRRRRCCCEHSLGPASGGARDRGGGRARARPRACAPPMSARTAATIVGCTAMGDAVRGGRSRGRHDRRRCRRRCVGAASEVGTRNSHAVRECAWRSGSRPAPVRRRPTKRDADDGSGRRAAVRRRRASTSRASTSPFSAGRPRRRASSPSARSRAARSSSTSPRRWRRPDVPLIVPEVNADAIEEGIGRGVYACPTAGATALAVVLLSRSRTPRELRRVAVTAFEPTSTAGHAGASTSSRSRRASCSPASRPRSRCFRSASRFNLDSARWATSPSGGRTRGEWLARIGRRVQIPRSADLPIVVTVCADADVLRPGICHPGGDGAPVRRSTRRARCCARAPGILLADARASIRRSPTSIGSDATHIGRLRDDPTVPTGLAHVGGDRRPAQGRRDQRRVRSPSSHCARAGERARRATGAAMQYRLSRRVRRHRLPRLAAPAGDPRTVQGRAGDGGDALFGDRHQR